MDFFLKACSIGFLLSIMMGPVFFILIETSIRKGFRAAVAFDLGVLFSDAIYILLAKVFIIEVSLIDTTKNKALFAFIGGLILNIMPCVLPVISLKLFGLISHSKESKSRILKHNLFYTFGVLATFFLFASVVAYVKINGQSIGWGFQLQSPKFVAFTIIVLFLMTLNLFGLFEFKYC